MERDVYERMAAQEERHWWFLARRGIVESAIRRLQLPPTARILEAGCGTGGNLPMLRRYGQVSAFEPDAPARALAAAKSGLNVPEGFLPDRVPFAGPQFDLIVCCDVLEHVEHDAPSLVTLQSLLKPGGTLLMTVPALPLLWSRHDVVHHHFRRYTRPVLRERLEAAGFGIKQLSYYNFFLFPPILAVRLVKRLFKIESDDEGGIPPPALNSLLATLMGLEKHLLPIIPLPVGVSLFALATAPAA